MARATTNPNVIVAELGAFIESRQAALGVAIVERLAAPPSEGGTPRKTGNASANWRIYDEIPADQVYGSKQSVDRAGQRANIAFYKAKAAPGIFRRLAGLFRRKRFKTLVIANFVPYIVPLIAGSSRQAPPGWYQAAIAHGLRTVR